jgi:hypothetical protein
MSNQNNVNSSPESSTTQSHIRPTVMGLNNKPSGSNPLNRVSDQHRAVLTACNSIVNQYRTGEISKAFAYASIQKRVYEANGISPSHAEEGFSSSYNSSTLTQKLLKNLSPTHQTGPSFPMLNGKMSLQVDTSILMQSSVDNSPPQTTMSGKNNSETSKSLLERLKQPKWLQMEVIGQSLGTKPLEKQHLHSHTVLKTLQAMRTTSSPSLL